MSSIEERVKKIVVEQLGVGEIPIYLAVEGATVVGGHHPAEAVVLGHQCIHRGGVDGITRDPGFGRIHGPIPANAEAGVNVMIA